MISLTARDEWTALTLAASLGHTRTVVALIRNAADINLIADWLSIEIHKNGETALILAASKNQENIVNALLDKGITFKAMNKYQLV